MLYRKYHFICQLKQAAYVPYYKGSTFRGVFGRSLKKVVCVLRHQECETCLLRARCLYTRVFESPAPNQSDPGTRRFSPRPFVIEPPLTHETHLPEGSSFDFHLILFGDANKNIPYFIYAFDRMGHIGIGRRLNGKRGKFVLQRVESSGEVIYSEEDNKINVPESFEDIVIENKDLEATLHARLNLFLVTPLRLKFKNRLIAKLPFHVLVRSALRRISSLFAFYGEGEPDLDYRGLVEKAREVQVVDSRLDWFDWKRYSFRQDRSMLMGGLVGSVVYEGQIGPFLPLIEVSKKLHLGKQTTFGLGKIKYDVLK